MSTTFFTRMKIICFHLKLLLPIHNCKSSYDRGRGLSVKSYFFVIYFRCKTLAVGGASVVQYFHESEDIWYD